MIIRLARGTLIKLLQIANELLKVLWLHWAPPPLQRHLIIRAAPSTNIAVSKLIADSTVDLWTWRRIPYGCRRERWARSQFRQTSPAIAIAIKNIKASSAINFANDPITSATVPNAAATAYRVNTACR